MPQSAPERLPPCMLLCRTFARKKSIERHRLKISLKLRDKFHSAHLFFFGALQAKAKKLGMICSLMFSKMPVKRRAKGT